MDRQKVIELLEKIQWSKEGHCPICGSFTTHGHDNYCELGQALAELESEPCKTCGGSGEIEFPDAVQAWDIPDAPIPTEHCPDCQKTAESAVEPSELTKKSRMRIARDSELLFKGTTNADALNVIASEALENWSIDLDIIDRQAAEIKELKGAGPNKE